MSQNLCSSIGVDQGQFVRKPLAVMQDPGAIFFLFFPMVRELQRTPMSDVAIFAFTKDPIKHSRSAEQTDMSAMEWCEGAAANVPLFR